MFLSGCTLAAPFAAPLTAAAFSFGCDLSSAVKDREVEKCFEEGSRERGATGEGPSELSTDAAEAGCVCVCVTDGDEFARKRDWEWLEK